MFLSPDIIMRPFDRYMPRRRCGAPAHALAFFRRPGSGPACDGMYASIIREREMKPPWPFGILRVKRVVVTGRGENGTRLDLAAYDELISSVAEAGQPGGSLSRMFRQICRALDAHAAGIALYDDEDATITHMLLSTRGSGPRSAVGQICALIAEPNARFVERMKLDQPRRLTDIFPEQRLRRMHFYHRYAELTGTGHGVLVDIRVSGIRLRLFVTRDLDATNFDLAETHLLGRVARHIGYAFTGKIALLSPDHKARDIVVVVYNADGLAAPFLRGQAVYSRIGARYGLTSTELRVLLVMAAGVSRDAGAMELGVSRDTLNTHMRHIYAKTGVSRLPPLLLLLQRAGVPIRTDPE